MAEIGIPVLDSPKRIAVRSEIRRIACRGGELAVEVGGKGPPVVLIHGWAVDRRMWAHQLTALRRRFTTITYDRRGSGQSSAPSDMRLELDDLDAILDELKLAVASLVGMSQGGRIALRYALSRPARVGALIVQGSPLDDCEPPAGDPTVPPLARYTRLWRQGLKQTLVQELAAHPLMNAGSQFVSVQAEIGAMLSDYRCEDLMDGQTAAAVAQPLTSTQLPQVESPTLVITGSEESLWLRRAADRTARRIYAARRRVIRGGGHFVNMTHPSDFNPCVVEFLIGVTQTWRS
ncbi:MAG: alpha/beta hydrolase [Gammaproteobacteria bacterium]